MPIATPTAFRCEKPNPLPPSLLVSVPGDEEMARRIAAADSIAAWVEVTAELPTDDGGYDIGEALRQNRRWSGATSP